MSQAASPRYQLSLALLSGGGLLLEISLTRLFSTRFYPPYVFAVISLAIFGLGLGAAVATLRPAWRRLDRLPLYMILAGYTAIALLLIVVWTTWLDTRGMLLGLVLWPYFFVGLALAALFGGAAEASPRLYRADLVGAGLGVILAVPLLNGLGSLRGVLLAAAIFGLAGLLLAGRTARWSSLGVIALALIGLSGPARLQIDMAHLSPPKPITQQLAAGGQILYTRRDAFARTDLIDPGEGQPYQLYMDGAAGSVMPPAGALRLLQEDIGFFPFATARPERVFIIGPGGGLDVWFALNGRAKNVTAVEVNPASVDIVNRFAAYHGDLYHQPGVRIIVDEGRSVLRRQRQKYDLIFLSQVVTLAAERNGYTLTENTTYTVEAFRDYLAHLAPQGQIALKLYDELTLTRAMVTAVTALKGAQGLSDAEALAHVAVFLDGRTDPPVPLLLVQAEPFRPEDSRSYAGVAEQVGFTPLFAPGAVAGPSLADILAGKKSLADLIAASPADVSPTTDNRPFFYQFERGLPKSLWPLVWGLGVVAAAVLGGAIWLRLRAGPGRTMPLYFAMLGLGFIMLEISLIQQTRLFLGHPTLAVTVVLAVLLLGGGAGSGLAGQWFDRRTHPRRRTGKQIGLYWPALGVALLALLWLPLWPWLSETFRAGYLSTRLAVVCGGLLPLALLIGMPFPLGLRLVGGLEKGDRQVALAWAINGVMTVTGSVAAIALAMWAGFTAALWVAAAAYGLAALFLKFSG